MMMVIPLFVRLFLLLFFFCKVFHVGKLGSPPCLYYTSFYVTLKIFLRLVLLPNRLTIKEKENL